MLDCIGGDKLWRSRDVLREGGRVATCGFQSKMRGGRLASPSEGRHPIRESAGLGWFVFRNWLKPGRKRMVPYADGRPVTGSKTGAIVYWKFSIRTASLVSTPEALFGGKFVWERPDNYDVSIDGQHFIMV